MFIVNLIIKIINTIVSFVSGFYDYRTFFAVVGFFATRKFPKAKKNHKYAVLVAARNEEMVIDKLVESVRAQDYPSELVDIFVVADNCTDNTAGKAREYGAVCYERTDPYHRTKGYALQFLVERIREDYGIDSYEGYFLFDADNLLKKDYISHMNDAFDSGERIITSYRNTKNFDDNWISASYGIHWIRTIRSEHRARSLFRLATRIQGTGFLFSHELIEDGWNYTSLTEDRAFCADAVAKGYRISYNNAAEFYDEQPVDMKIAMRQRIRWAKGHLQAFVETGGKLFKHIFVTGGQANSLHANNGKVPTSKLQRFVNNLRLRFMSFDMLTVVFPYGFMHYIKKILIYILRVILVFGSGLYITVNYAPEVLRKPLEQLGWQNTTGTTDALIWLTIFTLAWSAYSYVKAIGTAIYVFIIEHRRIKKIKWYKKVWFCFTFPIFDFIGKVSTLIALFTKVEWKPIPHTAAISISELDENKK